MKDCLVVNGCSYMYEYVHGEGHDDFAEQLGIAKAESLAISGCNNSRIIRSTLKHSYLSSSKNFYVIGATFVHRNEAPILKCDDPHSFEGRWTNPQNQYYKPRWEHHWTDKDTATFVELKLKEEVYSLLDRTEDLMYRYQTMIESLELRGHSVVIFQQADNSYFPELSNRRLSLFKSTPSLSLNPIIRISCAEASTLIVKIFLRLISFCKQFFSHVSGFLKFSNSILSFLLFQILLIAPGPTPIQLSDFQYIVLCLEKKFGFEKFEISYRS